MDPYFSLLSCGVLTESSTPKSEVGSRRKEKRREKGGEGGENKRGGGKRREGKEKRQEERTGERREGDKSQEEMRGGERRAEKGKRKGWCEGGVRWILYLGISENKK